MRNTRLRFAWRDAAFGNRYHSGVSLHSHTLHSRESLGFIYRVAAQVGFIDAAVRRGQRRQGGKIDLERGWWTPPLTPRTAWDLESRQIEADLGLRALVSLSDHDSIEGPLELRTSPHLGNAPISVEWTVPIAGARLHLGVHNMPPGPASRTFQAMRHYTSGTSPDTLGDVLRALRAEPATLVVLNHPLWDEEQVGGERHHAALEALRRNHGECIHALEINGLRPWTENLQAAELARAWGKPLVSGGDRHGLEPNALLNLTGAASFDEFAGEVRGGHSEIFITSHYRRPLFWRMFDAVLDAVGDHDLHGLGWKRWDQRVFYECDDGAVRSLEQIWGDRSPGLVRGFTLLARAMHRSWMQRTLRFALGAPRLEVTL
jgi:hypothetical protein